MADVQITDLISEGVFASRPAAADAVEYYATDTDVRYYSDGATWTAQPAKVETHVHAGTDVTTSTVAAARLPTLDAITAPAADVSMNTHKITSVVDPTSNQHAATKKYVDDQIAGVSGGASLASGSYKRTSGSYTTGSTTFVDIDGTNTNFTIVTGARRVACTLSGSVKNSGNTFSVYLDVDLDGTRLGGGDGGIMRWQSNPANAVGNGSFVYITDALSAGSHVFKFQWRVDGNTGTLFGDIAGGTDTQVIARFSVVELLA